MTLPSSFDGCRMVPVFYSGRDIQVVVHEITTVKVFTFVMHKIQILLDIVIKTMYCY